MKGTLIGYALNAYKTEYRLIKSIEKVIDKSNYLFKASFDSYPFTNTRMQYSSLNLINLGIEQSLIVHLDNEISKNQINGFWGSIKGFRFLVEEGYCLVPKIETKIIKPIPLCNEICIETKILKIRSQSKKCIVLFEAYSQKYFYSKGIGYIIKDLQL